ncbi:MAG TPA: TolC family protein, partial [Synergistaceae bacterium]|nr:TolC family protein [Synergistaceae bacterium]
MRGEKHDIRRLWRRWITMALGGVGMILGVGGASAEPLSLDDFLVRVVERHGEVAASAARLRAARAAAEAVAASQRPTVALRGEGARIFREQEGAASLYFSVQAPVDLWGRFDRICQQALLAYDLRAARHGELVNTLLTSAESLYWRAVLARADVVLYESLVRQREEDFRVAKKRHEVGSVAKLDVIRAEVQLESTRGELTSARTAYADYLVSLKALAGGTPVEPLSGDLAIPT